MAPVNGSTDGGERGVAPGETLPNTVRAPAPPRATAPAETSHQAPWPADRPAGDAPPTSAPAPAREATAGDLTRLILEGRWTVLAIASASVALAALYLFATPPTFESSILIQVEGRSRPVTAFEDLGALFQEATPTEGEMRILRSRTLLDAVVAELRLDVEARPRTFPVVGDALSRRHQGVAPAAPRLGLTRYAWGGERLRLERLEVSSALEGEALTLTALADGRYRVAALDGTLLAEGEVGRGATGTDGERSVELLVAELVARPGTEFELVRRRRIDVIEGLQRSLRIAEQGRSTGLVEVALSGEDPERVARILDAVSATYRRQSVERTSAEAAKTLGVLEAQLPVLRTNLEKAERALNRFQAEHGTVNLPLEGQGMLQRLVELDRAVGEAETEGAELARRRYTGRFPEVGVVADRIEQLKAQRAALEGRLRTLPSLELQSARLSRQVRVATELYLLVLNRAEELRIVKSGWIGNVRVLERAAVPHRPVAPKRGSVLAVALVLGFAGGVAAVLVRASTRRGASSPEEIEGVVGLPVYATVPRSAAERRLARSRRRRGAPVLSAAAPGDAAVEDLRGLRAAVQLALRQGRNNVVGVSGLAPGAGKSFVSANLAHLLAAADGRVLLVDADLRHGTLHRLLGVEAQPGLSDLLGGTAELQAVVRSTGTPGLDLLPAGTAFAHAGELLASGRIEGVLAELGRRYDVIVVDTPPVLAVADSALVGRHAGVNLLVLRAGEHSVPEISAALRRLSQGGVVVKGAILNDVPPGMGRARRWREYRRAYAGGAR